ncbi:MAG: mycofactocin biosynthesis glycosyltransferase MftF [Actinobacteria bacterium]|nr:mycofactocin biosynthesis glycosyltransferase MftF [Actinomycetota bacterium]
MRAATCPPADTRLPSGFSVRLLAGVRVRDGGGTVIGGDLASVLYLKPPAARSLSGDGTVQVRDPVTAALCRLLLDRGFAAPWWSQAPAPDRAATDVTVVVPVRDRPDGLARLLAALPPGVPVIVVDDGSIDQAGCARIAARHGATVRWHARPRGPAAARNTGLAGVTTPFVAFCDSDVVPVRGWLAGLRRHFDDPALGLVGPRVLGPEPRPGDNWISRYEAARSALDLGAAPAGVRPHGRISYLSSACLLARVTAVRAGFDQSLRVAEDVDLVWRLVSAGWRVRYEPGCVVRHEHRSTFAAWLGRKAYYGTGASLLAGRHGAAVAPLVLTPWMAAVGVSALAQRRWSLPVATVVAALTTLRIGRRLTRSRRPLATAAALTARGVTAVARQTTSALLRHHWPLALGAAVWSHRARRALLVAAVVDGALDHRADRPALDPVRFFVARRLDDLAYGAGLWAGAARTRSAGALIPSLRMTRRR